MDKERAQEIAFIIQNQIGSKALFMMGTKAVYQLANGGIKFDIKGTKKYRQIKIELNALDLYDVTFLQWRGTGKITKDVHLNVYAEDLHLKIEQETGLYLTL